MTSSGWTRIFKARPIRAVMVLVVVLGGWNLYLVGAGPQKISDDVAAAAKSGEGQRIIVELRFEPQRFHTLNLQDYGHVMRVDGDDVYLRSVSPGGLREISQIYWVSRILPQS